MKFPGMSPVRVDRDEHLHGEEAEQHDAGNADAPPDPPSSRTDEATQAPDRHDESGDPGNAERDPERGRRISEDELSGLSREDQDAGKDRRDSGARAGTQCHLRESVGRGCGECNEGP